MISLLFYSLEVLVFTSALSFYSCSCNYFDFSGGSKGPILLTRSFIYSLVCCNLLICTMTSPSRVITSFKSSSNVKSSPSYFYSSLFSSFCFSLCSLIYRLISSLFYTTIELIYWIASRAYAVIFLYYSTSLTLRKETSVIFLRMAY